MMDQELNHWLEFGWKIDDLINKADDFEMRESIAQSVAEHMTKAEASA